MEKNKNEEKRKSWIMAEYDRGKKKGVEIKKGKERREKRNAEV